MATILVTGATGNVGSQAVRELRARGAPVRAFVRDPARAAAMLGDSVELAVGDFEDATSVRRALVGVSDVLLSSTNNPRQVEHETGVIDAAGAAGVRRIVKLSTIGAEVGAALPAFDWHGRIEQQLRRSGVPAVILQSNFYMTNLLASAEMVKQTGRLFAPAAGGTVAMIDPRDVAAVAAVILTTEGHEGQTYTLTGPEAISHARVAADLSAATGRPIAYVDVPEEAARQRLVEAGMPDWLVRQITGVYALIRQGALAGTTGTVRAMSGREPRDFAAFARDHAALFGAAEPAARA